MLLVTESTIAFPSSSKRKSLRTTIPEFVVKTLEIEKGDKLVWEVMEKDGKKGFFFSKVEEK